MPVTLAPVDLLADLRHARASASPAQLRDTPTEWGLRPLPDARNHDVYARTDETGATICIKVFTKMDDEDAPTVSGVH